MKVIVNEECIGCGLCETICPQVFEMDGVRSKVVGNPENCIEETVDAASACPVNAIEVEEY